MTKEQLQELYKFIDQLNQLQREMAQYQIDNPGKPVDQYLSNIKMISEQIQVFYNQTKGLNNV